MAGMKRKVLRTLGGALLLLFVLWTIAPVVMMLYTSFAFSGIATGGYSSSLGFDNYREVFNDPANNFSSSLAFSVTLATAVTLFCILIGVPGAYALARRRTRSVNFIGGWIFSSRFLPPVVAAIPLFVVFQNLDLIGNPVVLVLLDSLLGLPISIWVLRSFIEDLPDSLEALAFTDGLTVSRRLWHVVLPNIRKPLIAVGAIIWLFVWNEFFFALMFSGSTRPLPVLIASWNTYQGIQWGPACAAGVMAAIPAILILLVSMRLLVRGFSFGWKAE